jgi:ELWxxDGT repeat protein
VADGRNVGRTILLGDLSPTSSDPQEFTGFAGKVFFTASSGPYGRELWTTDGMPGGTAPFKDVYPGGSSSNPAELTVAGSRLCFKATDGTTGAELWSTDGTAAGTTRGEGHMGRIRLLCAG